MSLSTIGAPNVFDCEQERRSKTSEKGTPVLHIEDILEVLEKVRYNSATFQGTTKECCICMMDYKDGDDVTILPCNRLYSDPHIPDTIFTRSASRSGSWLMECAPFAENPSKIRCNNSKHLMRIEMFSNHTSWYYICATTTKIVIQSPSWSFSSMISPSP